MKTNNKCCTKWNTIHCHNTGLKHGDDNSRIIRLLRYNFDIYQTKTLGWKVAVCN